MTPVTCWIISETLARSRLASRFWSRLPARVPRRRNGALREVATQAPISTAAQSLSEPPKGTKTGALVCPASSVGVRSETITETAFGFRARGGADWFVGRHFVIGFGAGYHFVTDFDQPIGADTNYSGPEFSIELGFVFGRRR